MEYPRHPPVRNLIGLGCFRVPHSEDHTRLFKRLVFVFVLLLAFTIEGLGAQRTASDNAPARGVVEEFVKMDAEGARLSPKGWEKADVMFTHKTVVPAQKVIIVIAAHYGVSGASTNGDANEFEMGCEELGRIDRSLHFLPANHGVETRSLVRYSVVATPAGWRIEGTQPAEVRITPSTADIYLRHVRDETKNQTLKANAEKSLKVLASY